MNPALVAAFDPLEWHCTGCGAVSGRRCPERQFTGLIQMTCPERAHTAQHYGMERWREMQTSRKAYPASTLQPNGAA